MKPGHAFVLGSGIGGLSIAEILSRSGWQITLVESSPELGGDASRCTQNWFHTGWLYAGLPSKAAMLGCHRSLSLVEAMYGGVLGPEILNVELGSTRRVTYPARDSGWFSTERVKYLYATATSDLSPVQRVLWKTQLRAVAFRRLRALGHDVSTVSSIEPSLVELLNHWEQSSRGYRKYTVIESTDAQINTRRVLNTLLSMLGDRTQVCSGARYSISTERGRSTVCIDGEVHRPDLVVIATGRSIPQILTELGFVAMAKRFKSVCSPIVVLKRALNLPNFIRFTPNLPNSVNHIKYETVNANWRSTVGSYDYFPVDQAPDISPFANRMCKRLNLQTSEVAGVYYGTKTEFVGSMERRYNHAIERVNENTFFAIPGKFSQFPLLAHEFGRHLGLNFSNAGHGRGALRREVALTAPELHQAHTPQQIRYEGVPDPGVASGVDR